LGKHVGIIYRRSGRVRPWLFPRNDQPAIEVTPANRLRLDDLDAIADAAALGTGLVSLPNWLVRDRIRAGALVQPLPDQPAFLYDA
jgi:DNA-binding transcriptional LysR family regulator